MKSTGNNYISDLEALVCIFNNIPSYYTVHGQQEILATNVIAAIMYRRYIQKSGLRCSSKESGGISETATFARTAI